MNLPLSVNPNLDQLSVILTVFIFHVFIIASAKSTDPSNLLYSSFNTLNHYLLSPGKARDVMTIFTLLFQSDKICYVRAIYYWSEWKIPFPFSITLSGKCTSILLSGVSIRHHHGTPPSSAFVHLVFGLL